MGSFADKFSIYNRFRAFLKAEDRFYGKLLASSLVGVLAIAMLAAILLFVAFRDHEFESRRARTLDLLRKLGQSENDITALETTYRGYLLTGQANYSEAFDHQAALVQTQLDDVAGFVGNESAQSARVEDVKRHVADWVKKIAGPGIGRRKHGVEPSAVDLTDERALLGSARQTLLDMEDSEQQLLKSHAQDQQSLSQSFQILLFAPKLENAISQMQEGEWGYLLTGDRGSVSLYQQAVTDFYAYHGHLTVLATQANEPRQLQSLKDIAAEMDHWQRDVAQPEFAAREANHQSGAAVTTDHGKEMIDNVRKQIAGFEAAEYERYEQAKQHAELDRVLKTAGFALLCLFAMGVLIASSWYSFTAYSRHLRKIESAEAQTRSIIEYTLDGIITMNDQGLVQSMNPAAEKMFGIVSKELVGQSVSKIIPQRLFLHDMAALGRGTMMAMGHRQNYYPFPIEISLSEMKADNKKNYVALIRDVTERKRSEETLKHIGLGVSSSTGEEFVRSLVKQLSKALQTDFSFLVETTKKNEEDNTCTLVIAEHGHIRSKMNFKLANSACEEVLKRGFRAFPNEVREKFPKDEILKELAAESFVAMPLVDHKGKTVGLMGVIDTKQMDNVQIAESTLQIFAARAAAEIERKRFEEDLNAEKERLAVTLRSIGDGFIATDMDGNVAVINNVAERLTGWRQDQIMGKPLVEIFNILNERTRKPCSTMLDRIVETGSVVGTANHAIVVSREGVERLIEISASPIRDKTNRKLGTVLVFRDITEKEHLEAERRKAEKLESLGVAAGGIAHDFNNLLTAIIGNLSLSLITVPQEDDMYERLSAAKKASLRAQELAQQLLTFAKGGAPIKKTASIGQLIHDTVTFSIRGSSIRADFETPDDLWPVEVDSGQISQVVNNLAINAEQAMPGGGTLMVKCENFFLPEESGALSPLRVGKYVKITVQDEGIGIPEEYLKKIFDPYFTTKPKGSGLGLATSYSIVKNHDGLITVDSKVGLGSLFSLYLPATDKQVAFERARQEPAKGKGRILALDDEEAICELVKAALTPLGYDVTTVQDALSAIDAYKTAIAEDRKFDAVISDLTIPGGMGGAECIKHLIEIDPGVKAIVSSGYAMDPVMSRYREYGFCACIAKPYEVSDLGHVVHDVLSNTNSAETLIYHDFVQSQLA
ncbi:MAG TPA: PAS domain S-box protein [Chthoniobacteraceae bacterium]|jgi:PAS domain S-box-containing protein|nr:PAS domain S-box protein [Chthoniobacteraceae bacterium]